MSEKFRKSDSINCGQELWYRYFLTSRFARLRCLGQSDWQKIVLHHPEFWYMYYVAIYQIYLHKEASFYCQKKTLKVPKVIFYLVYHLHILRLYHQGCCYRWIRICKERKTLPSWMHYISHLLRPGSYRNGPKLVLTYWNISKAR